MLNNKFISAIIVAAGSSSRMQMNVSKQLLKICDKTVLQHTVSAFVGSGIVDEIIVVCPGWDIENFKSLFAGDYEQKIPLKFTVGGNTRQDSVGNGIAQISEICDIVAIHDGARPLVEKKDIIGVVSDAIRFGASTLAVSVKDTIKICENSTVVSTPPREKLYIIQTPQVFSKSDYVKAYQKAIENGENFTDDCQ
ncbi:MAG: 2-C-methyl-D-erythritol 4-phosphate cytidylyltransferase, partial [Clostridia bacterium]|nr:2-C-methyl-D-erythritol 4-phosphate cytidylyltransferase [Clostridia bacterium]